MRQGGGNVVVKYSRTDGSTKLTNQPHFFVVLAPTKTKTCYCCCLVVHTTTPPLFSC